MRSTIFENAHCVSLRRASMSSALAAGLKTRKGNAESDLPVPGMVPDAMLACAGKSDLRR
jgi:hypothetical protein